MSILSNSPRRTFIRAAIITGIITAFFLPLAANEALAKPSTKALGNIIPDGYKLAQTIKIDNIGVSSPHYIIALSDTVDDMPLKPILLLHISWQNKWSLIENIPPTESKEEFGPNIVNSMKLETVGAQKLLYIYTITWGGGSGSEHYYSLYSIKEGVVRLLKTFEHERMERLYFCMYNNSIYDAKVVKVRGEKKGKAYIYTCYWNVTKYTCNEDSIIAVESDKCREMKGNRFLDEKYRCMSLLKAIKNGEVFSKDLKHQP
jgi:hypothetical protein